MELRDAVRRRRMVRRFDPARPVPETLVRELVDLARRAPSAGFTQGWDVVALLSGEDRERFWSAASPQRSGGEAWLRGVSGAPALLVVVSNPTAYLDRYAEPDKGWTDRDPARWPVPYWDTDAAMAAMVVLLGAVDAGLGALFFGVPAGAHDAVRGALEVPPERRLVGVIALGHEARRVSGSAARRRRRALDEVLHVGRLRAP